MSTTPIPSKAIEAAPGLRLNCEIDDDLWPWTRSTPVLMQHGFCRNAGFWRRWIPHLTAMRRVYRPEVRACGKSERPPAGAPLDGETLVSDVVRVIDALGLEKVHWIGESSGGVLGLLLALKHPSRVASLTLINTPARVGAFSNFSAQQTFGQPSQAAAIEEFGVAEWCRRTLGQRLDLDHASPELQRFFIDEMDKVPRDVAVAIQRAIEPIDNLPLLKTLDLPVLLMVGDKKKVALEQQQIMEREIPGARLEIFEGYGSGIDVLACERGARLANEFWETFDPVTPR